MVKNLKQINIPSKLAISDYIAPQEFSIPKPITNYLLKNPNVEIIKKLQKSCRYFLSKFNYNIIDNFSVDSYFTIEFENYDLEIKDSLISLLKNNLYLSKSLYIWGNFPENLFTKIIHCEIYDLKIYYCENLTFNDFMLLSKSETLKNVTFLNYIYYPDGTKAALEDILLLIPNVHRFSLSPCVVSPDTMTKLLSLKRNVKFEYLYLCADSEFPEIQLFFEFIKKTVNFHVSTASTHNCVQLMGRESDVQQLHDLFKTIREKCRFSDFYGRFKILDVF